MTSITSLFRTKKSQGHISNGIPADKLGFDDAEEENLESDLGRVGNHAFARMEGDVDKQRKLILQGQMSDAAVQKQHQRK
ncbi:hypothetical protein F2P81_026376 [Scophthalmus maximus]|uniref:Uncharacterized protein n=1 Tax=Scophthalmus maximus TaxID=52904 RepID=A0A6A4RPU5_SCOMX|nr:hypothetical protein F2P81_026376 [Scophthalmus maximus]